MLRHYLHFFCCVVICTDVQKQRQRKLLVLSMNQGSGIKVY